MARHDTTSTIDGVTSQCSELSHEKQSQIIANVLNNIRSENLKKSTKRFKTTVALSMDMKNDCERRQICSIHLGTL